jgi:hypothetical protein
VVLSLHSSGYLVPYGSYALAEYSATYELSRSKTQASTATSASIRGNWTQADGATIYANYSTTWSVMHQGSQLLARMRVPNLDNFIAATWDPVQSAYAGLLIQSDRRDGGCIYVRPATLKFIDGTRAQYTISSSNVTPYLLKNCGDIRTKNGTFEWTR